MNVDQFYPYLILAGASMLIASAWLLREARAQSRRSQELVQINERLKFDLPDFLQSCWPILQTGGFEGLRWRLEWFGTQIGGEAGNCQGISIQEYLKADEISLDVQLYQRKSRFEQRYFTQSLADNFLLLLRTDMWIKTGNVRSVFDQTAKMAVFLQHDMKNLLQLISLAADQLEQIQPGEEQTALAVLRVAIPAMRDRATYMLSGLRHEPVHLDGAPIALARAVKLAAQAYELNLDLEGDATVMMAEKSLHSILDNLLGNYAWQFRKKKNRMSLLTVRITEEDGRAVLSMLDLEGPPFAYPERLFEPFWSENGGSRGVGLYQARQLAHAVGGGLDVEAASDRPLRFILSLPC